MNGQRSSNIFTILRNDILNQNTVQYRNLNQLTRQGIDMEDFMFQEAIRQSMLISVLIPEEAIHVENGTEEQCSSEIVLVAEIIV